MISLLPNIKYQTKQTQRWCNRWQSYIATAVSKMCRSINPGWMKQIDDTCNQIPRLCSNACRQYTPVKWNMHTFVWYCHNSLATVNTQYAHLSKVGTVLQYIQACTLNASQLCSGCAWSGQKWCSAPWICRHPNMRGKWSGSQHRSAFIHSSIYCNKVCLWNCKIAFFSQMLVSGIVMS